MRFLISILLLCFLPIRAAGPVIQTPARAAAGASYQLLETFDNAGGDGYDVAGWTENGTPNQDSTTVILEGTQSLRVSSQNDYSLHSLTAQDETWFYEIIQVSALMVGDYVPIWIGNSGSRIGYVAFNGNTGKMFVLHGTVASTDTTDGIVAGQAYKVRARYVVGGGGNGIVQAEFVEVAGEFSGSGNKFKSLTTGDATAQPNQLRLGNGSASGVIDHDRLHVNSTGAWTTP